MMIELEKIVRYLDTELRIASVPDYPGALNGLQLENDGSVTKVAAAVDASLPVLEKAIAAGADLLIVHHGMFWHGAQKIVGSQYEKLKLAMDANMAVYSAHIPLDIHHEWGNNVLLCEKLGMHDTERFHPWKGELLGLKEEMNLSLDELVERVRIAVEGDVNFCHGRKSNSVGMVGVITGGAGSEVRAMADSGINTFITGEGPHWSYPLAEELGVNVIYGGHYATETFGVLKLIEVLKTKYLLCDYFVDHPTGL
ncbi:MAG: dinuclear metal center YbgI/SA1388 family protein [Rubritalea sp.]|jgi:dinuclear metal center YbgI/SA1388 family protein